MFWLKSQNARAPGDAVVVIGVVYPVHYRHLGKIERAHAVEARHIDAVLIRI